jgi:DNA-binding MarR family transcriptional regulator
MEQSREELMVSIEELLHAVFRPPLRRRHRPQDMEITIGQLECLRIVSRLDSPSMSELAHELNLQPSTVTGMVDKLVKAGKLQRVDDPDDRRVVRIEMTARGRAEHRQHHRQRRKRLMAMLGELSEKDLQKLHEGLKAMYEVRRKHDDDTEN